MISEEIRGSNWLILIEASGLDMSVMITYRGVQNFFKERSISAISQIYKILYKTSNSAPHQQQKKLDSLNIS